jgi:hypothetical protein
MQYNRSFSTYRGSIHPQHSKNQSIYLGYPTKTTRTFSQLIRDKIQDKFRGAKINPYKGLGSVPLNAPLDYGKRTLYAESGFRKHLESTIETIAHLPKLRVNVIHKVQQWQSEREKNAAMEGLKGARLA